MGKKTEQLFLIGKVKKTGDSEVIMKIKANDKIAELDFDTDRYSKVRVLKGAKK